MNHNINNGYTTEIPSNNLCPRTWICIAEYGDWPHEQGLQRFDQTSAREIVQYFKSIRGRLARKFGGLPVFIGHPDDANFSGQSGHTDTRAYAWIVDLEARQNGLYGLPRWSYEGKNLLRNAFYKHVSPRWAMGENLDGSYRPTRLISIGLTNHPNIPGDVIANETPKLADIQDGDWFPSGPPKQVTIEQQERAITELIDTAVIEGYIAPNERVHWENDLSTDFDATRTKLNERDTVVKTATITANLRQACNSTNPSNDLLALVNDRVVKTGEDFTTAWSKLKSQQPELFDSENIF
ncbi:MAG: phage protease [Verrucomicrobiota bacterium]